MADKTSKLILGFVVAAVCFKMRHTPALLLVLLAAWFGLAGVLYGLDRALRQVFKGQVLKGVGRG